MSLTLYNSIGWAVEKQTIAAGGGLTGPVLVSAVSTDPNTVRLTFDRKLMLEYRQGGVYHAATLDLPSYSIVKVADSSPLEIARVLWVDDTHIDLLTANQQAFTYRVTCVAGGVMDFQGNVITLQTADFTGQQRTTYTTPSDIRLFTSGYPGMQEDLTNDFYPDLVPPYIDDQYPAAAPPWVPNPPSTNVQVDIHDADEGVNLSTVRVYIEGALAYRGDTDSFLAPYNGPSSARITQPLGYRITIDPTSPFTSYQVVDVRVYAEDLAVIPNILDTLYQFRIADTSVPHLDNVVPAEGDTDVARNTNITLEILDSDSDVDEASVVITVAGVVAWQSQTAQPGFVVTATHLPTGWRYVINPDTDFASWQTVTVEVYATDFESPPNVLDTSYQFRTVDVEAPYIDNEDPAPGQLNVHPFANIQMDVLDAGSGVKANSVKLYVNGTIAYQNQVQQPGFVVARTPIGGGYRYLINPNDPLPVLTNTIRVVADDLATVPNHLDTSYTFQVSDATEPVIEDEFPLGENIPPSTHVSFTCWDNILVVKSSIQVTVGTEVAVQNGVFQVGWNGPASSIVANLFNGWDVVVDKETDIPYGSEVTVRVSIADLTGVPVTSTWTFLVNVDPTCFTGPINDFESSLLVPYDHAASTLYYTEQLRQYLLAVVQSRPDPIKAIRHVYLRANLGELGALLRNLAPAPTAAEKVVKLCYKRTAIQIDAALRRKPGLLNAVLTELTTLGLPKEHRELLWSYLRTDQPNDLVPLACVMVCLAKILEQNALS